MWTPLTVAVSIHSPKCIWNALFFVCLFSWCGFRYLGQWALEKFWKFSLRNFVRSCFNRILVLIFRNFSSLPQSFHETFKGIFSFFSLRSRSRTNIFLSDKESSLKAVNHYCSLGLVRRSLRSKRFFGGNGAFSPVVPFALDLGFPRPYWLHSYPKTRFSPSPRKRRILRRLVRLIYRRRCHAAQVLRLSLVFFLNWFTFLWNWHGEMNDFFPFLWNC